MKTTLAALGLAAAVNALNCQKVREAQPMHTVAAAREV
jgi:hypothetical protein